MARSTYGVQKCGYAVTMMNFLIVTPFSMITTATAETETSSDPAVFKCQYIAELFVEQGNRDCAPYDCWHSQLLDLSRDTLIDIFNDYKAAIAQRKCDKCAYPSVRDFGPVFYMHYHWVLELTALHYQRAHNRTCEFQRGVRITANDLPAEVYNSEYSLGSYREFSQAEMEYSSVSFKLAHQADQTTAIEKFKKLLFNDRKYNLFEAWNGTTYRYTLAGWFGCALTIRNNVTGVTSVGERVRGARVAYLACVFLFETSPSGTGGSPDCTWYNATFDPRTKLCNHVRFGENAADDIPCQLYYHVSKEAIFLKCKEEPLPRIWLQNEAPDPRHRKIHIKIENSAIVEVAVASGQTKVKSVQKAEQKNLTKSFIDDSETGNSEEEAEFEDADEEEVDGFDYFREYELIDEYTTRVSTEDLSAAARAMASRVAGSRYSSRVAIFSSVFNESSSTGRTLARVLTETRKLNSHRQWNSSTELPPAVALNLVPATRITVPDDAMMLDTWKRKGTHSDSDFADQTQDRMDEVDKVQNVSRNATYDLDGSDGACTLQHSELILPILIWSTYLSVHLLLGKE